MRTIEDLLREHPFFADFDSPIIALLAGCATNVHLRQGETLFREDEPAEAFYVLRSGRISLQVHSPAGGPVVVDTVEHDEVVGWSWIVAPYHWTSDAVAALDTSAVRFEAGCLRGKISADPVAGYAFLQQITRVLAHRLTSAHRRLLDVYGTGGPAS